MMMDNADTSELLERIHAGDGAALAELFSRHRPFLSQRVRAGLSPLLRHAGDTDDWLQELFVKALTHGARFVVANEGAFRAIMVRMIENLLADGARHATARKRDQRRDRPLPTHSTVLYLDDRPRERTITNPGERARLNEETDLVRLALDLLPPEVRLLIDQHNDGMSLAAIADTENVSAEAIRKRLEKAKDLLARVVVTLKYGRLSDALHKVGIAE